MLQSVTAARCPDFSTRQKQTTAGAVWAFPIFHPSFLFPGMTINECPFAYGLVWLFGFWPENVEAGKLFWLSNYVNIVINDKFSSRSRVKHFICCGKFVNLGESFFFARHPAITTLAQFSSFLVQTPQGFIWGTFFFVGLLTLFCLGFLFLFFLVLARNCFPLSWWKSQDGRLSPSAAGATY